jgi:hypothetical protein
MSRFGRVPFARIYNGGAPLSAAHFQPGGLCYRGAGVGVAGVTTAKRLNMSVTYNPAAVTSSSSTLAVQMRSFASIVPVGWYVQIVLHHEYNLHTTDQGGDGATGATMAQYLNSFPILAQAISDGDAGNGRCIAVINPSWDAGAFNVLHIPTAASMPLGSECHMDIYDNPKGTPPGYKKYGTTYRGATDFQTMYNDLESRGWMAPGYGWGIDEFNAPRRIAPKLATLNSTYGWGPLSPNDVDGSGMATSIKAMCDFCLNATVTPSTVLWFTGTGAWNQRAVTAGTANDDAPPGDSLHQGWPITVDPSKVYAAYKAYVDISR